MTFWFKDISILLALFLTCVLILLIPYPSSWSYYVTCSELLQPQKISFTEYNDCDCLPEKCEFFCSHPNYAKLFLYS